MLTRSSQTIIKYETVTRTEKVPVVVTTYSHKVFTDVNTKTDVDKKPVT